jgi:hypothetical protein
MGDYVSSREQFRFAVSKQPDNGTYLYHLAKSYEANAQKNDAVEIMKKAAASRALIKRRAVTERNRP